VNVWVYQRNEQTILVDSSSSGTELITKLDELNLNPTHLLTTHHHPDHVGGHDELLRKYPQLSQNLPQGCEEISTPGHISKHSSFYFPDEQICFCGDALFAGSMGRPNVSYEQSLASLYKLLSLPKETVLCPGHGPATTVDQEHEFNCFYI